MAGFKVFRGTDVPSASTLKRVRDVLDLEPEQVSWAVQFAASRTRPGMYGAAELGTMAAELGLEPEVGA